MSKTKLSPTRLVGWKLDCATTTNAVDCVQIYNDIIINIQTHTHVTKIVSIRFPPPNSTGSIGQFLGCGCRRTGFRQNQCAGRTAETSEGERPRMKPTHPWRCVNNVNDGILFTRTRHTHAYLYNYIRVQLLQDPDKNLPPTTSPSSINSVLEGVPPAHHGGRETKTV